MTLSLGDEAVADNAVKITVPGGTSGVAGDACKWDASNDRVIETTANDDDIFGIFAEDTGGSNDDPVAVWIQGLVVANAGGSVVQGDVLIADSSTNGRLIQNSDSTGKVVDVDGTTDQGVFAPTNPEAVTDSGGAWPLVTGNSLGTNEAVVRLY